MGDIRELECRNNVLSKPHYCNSLSNWEENIHVHYRDLCIEEGRGEYKKNTNTFLRKSKPILAIIHTKNYQDGIFSRFNKDIELIWIESPFKIEVKFHPQRFIPNCRSM